MERLTERFSDGEAFIPNRIMQLTNGMQNVIRKLAEYEDAEEQGLLLRLPCRFGDTVWWIAPNCVGEPSMVLDTKFDDSMINRLNWFGKVFFTTKEEAEQALAKMKG